jgi:hypothetical protein
MSDIKNKRDDLLGCYADMTYEYRFMVINHKVTRKRYRMACSAPKDSSTRRRDSMQYMQTNNKPSTMESISNNEPHQGESNFNRNNDASLTDSIQQLLDLCAT